jgi:hypothetical protein
MASKPELIPLTCSGCNLGESVRNARLELRSVLGLTDEAGSIFLLEYVEPSWPGRDEMTETLQFYTRTKDSDTGS